MHVATFLGGLEHILGGLGLILGGLELVLRGLELALRGLELVLRGLELVLGADERPCMVMVGMDGVKDQGAYKQTFSLRKHRHRHRHGHRGTSKEVETSAESKYTAPCATGWRRAWC